MGYDFRANADIEGFRLGAFSFPRLIEGAWGTFFPIYWCGAKWVFRPGLDERMGDKYPLLISNDDFPVDSDECPPLARMTRNYVELHRGIEKGEPDYIREDWLDQWEAFAEWMEKSEGFTIG